ncbi:cysteine desulfurase family protein [Photobacterium sanctipauli]|nr:cysteine desulfurase family protein [Photobacterium sanctipauli]
MSLHPDTNTLNSYFDYNATTPMAGETMAAIQAALPLFANPSSNTLLAKNTKHIVSTARQNMAALLGAKPEQIFFTSGGSESNNWAIKGVLYPQLPKPGHIITTAIEHPSVLSTLGYFEQEHGFSVTYLKPDHSGAISTSQVENAIKPNTQLISIMTANNETGRLQPIESIAKLAQQRAIPFHVDAVQQVGKTPFSCTELGVDFASVSAHKFYGPKGIGCLYIKEPHNLNPLIHGGGQEDGMRSGTENLLALSGLAAAAEQASIHIEQWHGKAWQQKQLLMQLLDQSWLPVSFNGALSNQDALTNCLNASINGLRGEALALRLELNHGIQVSIGSACSNNKQKQLSHVLSAMQISEQTIQSAIRISFGQFTTEQDIRYLVAALEAEASALLGIGGKIANG